MINEMNWYEREIERKDGGKEGRKGGREGGRKKEFLEIGIFFV